ncbi:MAG: glutathione S-transferase, partial [Rhodospirillales bacterium]
MPELEIVIGTKAWSSWSLRPWLALKATGRKFKETLIELRRPDTRAKILKHSPAGFVPILKHGSVTVWESLAICEYLAETGPAARLWPTNPATRAAARCAATEMHGGFAPLREAMSIDVKLLQPTPPMKEALTCDFARVSRIWIDTRR